MCMIKNVLSAGGNDSPAIMLASGVERLSSWTDGSNEVEEEVLLTAQSFGCYAAIPCVCACVCAASSLNDVT